MPNKNSGKRHTRSNSPRTRNPLNSNTRYNVNENTNLAKAIKESENLQKLKNSEELAEQLEALQEFEVKHKKKREKANHNLAMSLQKGSNNISAANLEAIEKIKALNSLHNKEMEKANHEMAKKLQEEYNSEPSEETKEDGPPKRYFERTREVVPGPHIPRPNSTHNTKSKSKSKSISNSTHNTKSKSKSNATPKRWWRFFN